jgi:DNA/RNA endonuclease YhcR with UshA esterase domain
VGESVCVSGKVVKVAESKNGAWFLDFCEDYTKCPFTVVVFSRDLRDVGDIRKLVGQDVEIFGKVKLYGGRAEIILKDARQLHGESAKLPPMPKDYDASRHGRYSAGRYRTKGRVEDLDPEKR